jgi:DNA-directed RNA polymerase specialized sigma24 family protein
MEEPTYAQRVAAEKRVKDTQAWTLRQQGLTYKAIGKIMGVGVDRARQRVECHKRRLKREAPTQPKEN